MSGQSGYFAVAERDGIFWLIDPTGRRFLSKGVNAVRFDQDRIQGSDRIPYAEACKRKYGNQNAWRAAAAGRLARWGFRVEELQRRRGTRIGEHLKLVLSIIDRQQEASSLARRPLPAALVGRRAGGALHRPRRQQAGAGLRLFRGGPQGGARNGRFPTSPAMHLQGVP